MAVRRTRLKVFRMQSGDKSFGSFDRQEHGAPKCYHRTADELYTTESDRLTKLRILHTENPLPVPRASPYGSLHLFTQSFKSAFKFRALFTQHRQTDVK